MEASRVLADLLGQPVVLDSFERLAAMQHGSAWADVAAKAKRLVQEGKVTILRNAPHHVMSHVVGDGSDNGGQPDEHEVEISRHDPASQVIEQWNCDCAWAQYAWDRTRKWKKYEGRVCSHVLATYWKARGTPLDTSDYDSDFQKPPGQRGPGGGPGQQILPGMTPDQLKAQQDAQALQDEGQAGLPGEDEAMTGQPGVPGQQPPNAPTQGPLPSTQDLTVPKGPVSPYTNPEKQQQPAAPQRQQLQLFDITAPPGMQPIPGASPVSVPGGRPPTPGNPVQFPGTFSHFLPVLALYTSNFIYANDALSDFFAQQRAAHMPIYVALNQPVTLELQGGKIPLPGAMPYTTSQENVPIYNVMDLGFNPQTGLRENADVNMLQGAPEQTGTYADVTPGRRGEVLDYDPNLKLAYVVIPLNYPDKVDGKPLDVRLHPHSVAGWVDFKDLRPVQQVRSPWRRKR